MSWGSKLALLAAAAALTACGTPLQPLQTLLPEGRDYRMPTGSMEPTLLLGDYITVLFVDHPNPEVTRGEIVAFAFPPNEAETYIKRVVGVPGDRIKLHEKKLILNGRPMDEPYVVNRTSYLDSYRDNFPSGEPTMAPSFDSATEMLESHVEGDELVIPDGNYFVLGDNRDLSSDSRFWGFVPEEHILGKPWIVWYSVETDMEDDSTSVRWDRIGKAIEGYPLGAKE